MAAFGRSYLVLPTPALYAGLRPTGLPEYHFCGLFVSILNSLAEKRSLTSMSDSAHLY